MDSPITISEDKLNARRKPVVLNGIPLLALAFQTLGVLIPASHHHVVSHTVQALSTPILALSAFSSFHEASSSTDTIFQSPLYVLNGIWTTTPSAEDVIGGRLGLYHHLLVGQAGKSFFVGTLRVVLSGCGCVLRLRPSRFLFFLPFLDVAVARRIAFVPLFSSLPSSSFS